jgi:hypothetical protein
VPRVLEKRCWIAPFERFVKFVNLRTPWVLARVVSPIAMIVPGDGDQLSRRARNPAEPQYHFSHKFLAVLRILLFLDLKSSLNKFDKRILVFAGYVVNLRSH